jgi:hypothetical protein
MHDSSELLDFILLIVNVQGGSETISSCIQICYYSWTFLWMAYPMIISSLTCEHSACPTRVTFRTWDSC